MNLNYPIYIINLKKNTDRIARMNILMKKYKLPYNRFEAIYGKNMGDDEIEKYVNPVCSKLLCNNGEIGCAMSHYTLWKQLCNDDDNENYIIFEDDILEIKTELLNKVCTYIEKENFRFDIINLHCMGRHCQRSEIVKIDDTLGLCHSPYPLGTLGYIISKRGARRLVNLIEKYKITVAIDNLIAYYKIFTDDFLYFTTNPDIVGHNLDIPSTIQNNATNLTVGFASLFGKTYARYLNAPAFVINRKYEISAYIVLMIILLLINYYFIKSSFLLYYILVDLTIYFISSHRNKK